jgi:hypothetical protein
MRMETPPDERVMSSTGDAPSEGAAQREIPTSPFVGTGPQGKAGTGTVIQHLRGILPRTPLTEASAKSKDPATVSLLAISVSPPAISCEAPPPRQGRAVPNSRSFRRSPFAEALRTIFLKTLHE